jgi:hypothetical protein
MTLSQYPPGRHQDASALPDGDRNGARRAPVPLDGAPNSAGRTVISTGCSAAWLARLLWEQEVAGSNPAIPTGQTNLSNIFLIPEMQRVQSLAVAVWRLVWLDGGRCLAPTPSRPAVLSFASDSVSIYGFCHL